MDSTSFIQLSDFSSVCSSLLVDKSKDLGKEKKNIPGGVTHGVLEPGAVPKLTSTKSTKLASAKSTKLASTLTKSSTNPRLLDSQDQRVWFL